MTIEMDSINEESRDIIVHSHIFKNAGTTFDHSLKKNFGIQFIDHREDADIVRGKLTYLKEFLKNNKEVRAFSSHSIHFRALDDGEFNFHQIYFLRHPIERIKSVFTFEKQQPAEASTGAKMAKELEFDDYIEWRMRDNVAATIRNCQTIFLSGDGPHTERMEEKFTMAMANIDSLPLIGVVDRFDESMVVFEEYLKKYFEDIDLSYVRKNITDENLTQDVLTKSEELLSQLDGNLREMVLAKNSFDISLYAAANEKLDKQMREINDFGNKLESFQTRGGQK